MTPPAIDLEAAAPKTLSRSRRIVSAIRYPRDALRPTDDLQLFAEDRRPTVTFRNAAGATRRSRPS
jgi:hypothetical protein